MTVEGEGRIGGVTRIYTKIRVHRASNPLTGRDPGIVALLAAGNSTSDIPEKLGISPGTVKAHLPST